MRAFISKVASSRRAMIATAGASAVGVLAVAVPSFALTPPPYDPSAGLTDFSTAVGNQAGPIVIAVATALVGLVLLFWGVRFVFGLVRGGVSH